MLYDPSHAAPAATGPRPFLGTPEILPTWKLWVARFGLVMSFLFFFTIPGWFALAGYRRWRKGKGVTPAAALFWGYLSLLGLALSAPVLIWAAIKGALG